MCPSVREETINPKQNPPSDDTKSLCIYLTSPHKAADHPINTSDSIRRLNEREQRVRNTRAAQEITWQSSPKVPLSVSPGGWVPRWTLWVEAHGAPMWFFGAEPTLASERLGTRDFAAWVLSCEAANDVEFASVVLDSCFSAAEQCPAGNRTISPARAVSLLLPGKRVIGYLGKNNSATITGLTVAGEQCSLKPAEGTALFMNGVCREGPTHRDLRFTAESLAYSKDAMLTEFGVTKSTEHVLGAVPGADNEPSDVTKLPARALGHLRRLDKIWTTWLSKPSFFQ